MKKYRMVVVEWMDAAIYGHGWEDTDAIAERKPQKCVSIGFLVRQSKTEVVITQTLSDDGQALNQIVIPTSFLCAKVRTLKV